MATTGKGMPMTHNMAQNARLPMLIAFAPEKDRRFEFERANAKSKPDAIHKEPFVNPVTVEF
jgi:hypothetical protein